MDQMSAGVNTGQSLHQDHRRQENGLEAEERSENLPAESPGRVNQLRAEQFRKYPVPVIVMRL